MQTDTQLRRPRSRLFYSGAQFYPTPRRWAELIVERAEIESGQTVLEPHAGEGDVALVVRERHPDARLYVNDLYPDKVQTLKGLGFHGWQMDFLKMRGTFDRIVGNPPWCNNFQDCDHFRHAWDLLPVGGRIAFLMHEYSAFPLFRHGDKPHRFAEWLDRVGGSAERLPPGAFIESRVSTPTKACVVWALKRSPVRQLCYNADKQTADSHGLFLGRVVNI